MPSLGTIGIDPPARTDTVAPPHHLLERAIEHREGGRGHVDLDRVAAVERTHLHLRLGRRQRLDRLLQRRLHAVAGESGHQPEAHLRRGLGGNDRLGARRR